MPPAAKRSIGQVLAVLKPEFPDISISKIRFLEGEGLLAPERAPSGYRLYVDSDIERLAYILRMQRDHYLPLKVIREHLDVMDRGGTPPQVETISPLASEEASAPVASTAGPEQQAPMKLTRRQLLQVSGLSEATLIELERQQMIAPRRGSMYYGREALMLCVTARRLTEFGMDTRHLRAIKQAAEREAGLIEQAARPAILRSANPSQTLNEVSKMVVNAHAAIMFTLLQR